jgi:hypothetical protein
MLSDKFRCLRSRNTVAFAVKTVLGFGDLSDNDGSGAVCAVPPLGIELRFWGVTRQHRATK